MSQAVINPTAEGTKRTPGAYEFSNTNESISGDYTWSSTYSRYWTADNNLTITANYTDAVEADATVTDFTASTIFDGVSRLDISAGVDYKFEAIGGEDDGSITTTGNMVVTEKLAVDNLNYRYFSVPFDCSVASIVSQNSIAYCDKALDAADYDFTVDHFAIFAFDEKLRTEGNEAGAAYTVVASTATLQANRGYAVAIVESDGHLGTTVNDVLTFPSTNTQQTFYAENAPVTISGVQHTDGYATVVSGWNMIGNPYYHAVSSEAFGTKVTVLAKTKEGNDTVCQIDHDMDAAQTISARQAVFTQVASSVTEFTVNESNPASAAGVTPEHFTIQIGTNGIANDRTSVIHSEYASDDYVIGEDLAKWFGSGYAQIYSIIDNVEYAYNKLNLYTGEERIIPLGVRIPQDGTYTLSLCDEKTEFEGEVYLHDILTNTYTNLREQAYTVQIANGTLNNRFEIVAHESRIPQGVDDNDESLENVYVSGNELVVEGLADGSLVILYDATGKQLTHERASGDFRYDLAIRGVYFLTLRNGDNTRTIKIVY